MTLIAGEAEVAAVMAELVGRRAVFHSEADFQHAFAWTLHSLRPSVQVRLEARQAGGEHVDLLCFGPQGRTAIEFKYFTARWDGTDPATGEQFRLREHAADDLARRNFIFDVARLERLCAADPTLTSGFAIMLTNHQPLWAPPRHSRLTRDQHFRIHDGRTVTGTLRWGTEGSYYADNERTLIGSYRLAWNDYTRLDGANGQLRWLGVQIRPSR
ncbi:hypothetical protein [Micromonospora costi]|uniref:Uncharacterized protein n=1 Tax=Micromonospora costi TaxID=1530042 RepID=A0A3A9ZPK8_9ACTN|nr:hypothetical protein [Micromonospora costi]RKN50113.1 hypothetical protein D7193_30105 [Micromonospora costi]